MAFSPSGKYLATVAADETLRLWRIATGEQLRCHHGACAPLAFSGDGRQIVSGAPRGGLLVWRLTRQ